MEPRVTTNHAVERYESPEVLASYTREELEAAVRPAGDTPNPDGGGGCGCGGGSILVT